MIRLSKLRPEDTEILVFDVRPKSICEELNTEPKVLLGRMEKQNGYWTWESRWGYNRGEQPTQEAAQAKIEACAKGMYR